MILYVQVDDIVRRYIFKVCKNSPAIYRADDDDGDVNDDGDNDDVNDNDDDNGDGDDNDDGDDDDNDVRIHLPSLERTI
jgi:hypothetical protein